jgi:CheY-like chemotaxis protein
MEIEIVQSQSRFNADVTMPDLDRLEMGRTVRSLPQFQDLPIIMVTARDRMFDQVQEGLAGATEYLTKPFENEKLVEMVHQFIDTVSQSPASD